MINLTPEEEERYSDLAMKHAHFLCDKVFKPAFEIAFIHGAKHMKEDMMSGGGCANEPKAFKMGPGDYERQQRKATAEQLAQEPDE